MDRVHKPGNSECYAPSSEPFSSYKLRTLECFRSVGLLSSQQFFNGYIYFPSAAIRFGRFQMQIHNIEINRLMFVFFSVIIPTVGY
jgi:hypothetical protein